ncbi:MAG: FAD-binding protein, partial [Candidatus Hodarchaeota archaeon]
MSDIHTSDYLVIGSGVSGLLFSLKASLNGKVNLVTKGDIADSATNRAQGGIAAVMSSDDSYESHIEDTMRVGAGLCHKDIVENIVKSGPERIRELIDMGVEFCQNDQCTEFDLGLEGGHSNRRVLHVKDHTGRDIENALVRKIRKAKGVEIFENHIAVNLYVK